MRCFTDQANRTGVVAATPKRWQATTQVRELGAQYPAASALEPIGYPGNAPARVTLNEQVNVVWNDFECVDSPSLLVADFPHHILKTHSDINSMDIKPPGLSVLAFFNYRTA